MKFIHTQTAVAENEFDIVREFDSVQGRNM